jgi:hypothetical protein
MNIKGKITSVEYTTNSNINLKEININELNINDTPSCFLLNLGNTNLAVSKWVSPKRTRSYPYERVYNTLSTAKKITVIPVVKDEGTAGDRDFIQWDTIALMSLLDVYVIPAFYNYAEKKERVSATTGKIKTKITNQKFDNDFILGEIGKIPSYHSSALHWNLKQLESLPEIVKKVKENYKRISIETGVKLKSERGIDNFLKKTMQGVKAFMDFSRSKAAEAQQREFVTIQPKEALSTLSKAKITINNYLGGLYYFTVDEIILSGNSLQLIEAKHTKSGKIPSRGDIKDGLLKMILYSNLEDVTVDDLACSSIPVLKLTSSKMIGSINSNSEPEDITNWFEKNKLSASDKKFIDSLLAEAITNNFQVLFKAA